MNVIPTRDELRKVFHQYDEDETGRIGFLELKKVFDSYGMYFDQDEEDLKALKTKGNVSFKEYVSVMKARMPSLEDIYATREVEMRQAFDMFDKDGSGKISSKEFKYSLIEMGRNLSDVEFDALMAKYDTNKDGFINFEEFKAIMKKEAEEDC